MQTKNISLPPELRISQSTLYALQKNIHALNLNDGKIERAYQMQNFGRSNITNGMIYTSFLSEKQISAFRLFDGNQQWISQVEGGSSSAPTVADDIVYVSTYEGSIFALQASSGTPLWRQEVEPILKTSPTMSHGVLYIASASKNPSIHAFDAKRGSLLWRIAIPASSSSPLTVLHNHIYVNVENSCLAFHIEDGSLAWQQEIGGQGNYPPVAVGNAVYISFHEVKYTFSPSKSLFPEFQSKALISSLRVNDGHILWQQHIGSDTDAKSLTSPVLKDGKIYIGSDDGYLSTLDKENGTLLWRYKTKGSLLSSPVVEDTSVYVGANDGSVYALKAEDGSLIWQTFIGESLTVYCVDKEI